MSDRDRVRAEAIAAIKKKLKKDVITAEDFSPPKVDPIPSGSIGLDNLLGVGGYPRGRVIEIFGPNASGKTTLTLHAIANCQKQGGLCAFVDAEHTFDKAYSAAIGVDLSALDLYIPTTGEEALDAVELLTSSGAYDLIVIDSVSALVPSAEMEADMGQSGVAQQARMMSKALRKLTGPVADTGTAIIFLNQLREKVGVMFGNPETTSGGNAMSYFASVRLDIRRTKAIKEGDRVVGNRTKVKVVKNKLAGTAYHTCEFDMYANNEFGAGICYVGEVFDAAVEASIIDKSGAWYSFENERLGQGKQNCVNFLKENETVFKKLDTQVRSFLRMPDVREE